MSSMDDRYAPATGGGMPPPVVSPSYGNAVTNPPDDIESARKTRCATGIGFIKTVHGILNLVIIIALICVLISAGVSSRDDARNADNSSYPTSAKVSAFNTRNAVLVFAAFGLFLILLDTVLHMTRLINRLPAIFDTVFIIVMLVFAGIYLILGCCAAAWEKKQKDTLPSVSRPGAAAAAAFFLFVAMIAIVIDFLLRLLRPGYRATVK